MLTPSDVSISEGESHLQLRGQGEKVEEDGQPAAALEVARALGGSGEIRRTIVWPIRLSDPSLDRRDCFALFIPRAVGTHTQAARNGTERCPTCSAPACLEVRK